MSDDDLFDVTGMDDDQPKIERTILDSLQSELSRVVHNEPITLVVPSRPTISLKFDTNIDSAKLQLWRKASQDKSMPDNFDGVKFSAIIIANQCTHVMYDGKIATDVDGVDLNFRNNNFLGMLNSQRAIPAVRKLYGVDGHIFIAADAILRAAGYDSEEQDQSTDPTLLT